MTSIQVLRFPRTFARKLLVAAVALLATAVAAAAADRQAARSWPGT